MAAEQRICVTGKAEKTSSCRPERLFFERVKMKLMSISPSPSTGRNVTP